MAELFRSAYRIPSARLQDWDYGWNAAYFVTICTRDRENYFGTIADEQMQLSAIGALADKFWREIPEHFTFVELDAFVVMPNHVHGILLINKPKEPVPPVETRHCLVSPAPAEPPTPGQQRVRNQGKHTLSSIIGSYKSMVTRHARQLHVDFAWQTRFHDHIICNQASHQHIADYIINNPLKWPEDVFYRPA